MSSISLDFQRLVASAHTYLGQADWAGLAKLASSLRSDFPGQPDGFLLGRAALLGEGHREAAGTLLSEAIKFFPNHEQFAIDYAWLAQEDRNWPEAKCRWENVKRCFPGNPIGYVGIAVSERELQMFCQADAAFSDAISRFPNNVSAYIEFAWAAHQRGDIPAARERWTTVRDRFPDNRYGYLGAAVTEQTAGELLTAEALLADGHKRFPFDEELAIGYGWIANMRKDWHAAVVRWRTLAQMLPNHEAVARGLNIAGRALTETDGIASSALHSPEPQDPPLVVPDPGRIVNGVLIGRNNVLFLAEGGHSVLDFATRHLKVSDDSYNNFIRNLVQRHRNISSRGACFLHVIFPDKHSVYGDDFPVANPAILGAQYLERFPALSHYICYLRDVLRRTNHPTFMSTDTHLTDFGTILASAEIVTRLVEEPQDAHIVHLLAETNVEFDWSGDLGNKLNPPHHEKQLRNPKKWIRHWYHNKMTGGNNGIIDIYFNENSVYEKRLIWFGDSFGRSACQFMAFFFREVVFFRTPFFHIDIFEQIRPDYVVTQNVERYLSFVHSDEDRPAFFLYPYLSEHPYNPDVDFATAMSAVLSYGRKPYKDFLAKIGLCDHDLES